MVLSIFRPRSPLTKWPTTRVVDAEIFPPKSFATSTRLPSLEYFAELSAWRRSPSLTTIRENAKISSSKRSNSFAEFAAEASASTASCSSTSPRFEGLDQRSAARFETSESADAEIDFPKRSDASFDLEAASREPSVMARRSGVEESRAATTAKRSVASADASAADGIVQ